MSTQLGTSRVETKELIAALARDEELVVMPLKQYNSLLDKIEELRDRLQDMKDARLVEEIKNDPKQRWFSLEEAEAQLRADGVLDAV